MKRRFVSALLLLAPAFAADPSGVEHVLDVAAVWSGHPVGFELLTQNGRQFVAFYDADRRMTVAWRTLDSKQWKFVRLPSEVKWDSHNYITMAIDDEGYLHLSGNMHVQPLVYFRSAKPYDPGSLQRVDRMVGLNEERCTYPVFFRGPAGAFIFTYRDGRSGNGNQVYNVYDPRSREWRRLLDTPFTDGEGQRNAYIHGPVLGPDGYFHMVWTWRESPDCSTNHDLSYARSKDLIHWETSGGRPLSLPIRLSTAEIVDPVPVRGGLINGNTRIGFDSRRRVVISYHKHDAAGNTQIYCARPEDGKWKIYQVSHWNYRWEFHGGGSIHFEIRVGEVKVTPAGLVLDYSHDVFGAGRWKLDERDLRVVEQLARPRLWPEELDKVESSWPGMTVQVRRSKGDPSFLMRWETLGPNRDRPREGPPPPPSMLRVYKMAAGARPAQRPR